MLAALTTKRYNTSTQMHKKHKKEEKNTASTQANYSSCAEEKKIPRSQHTAQTVLTCPYITTGFNVC